jgi:hypothetical protein
MPLHPAWVPSRHPPNQRKKEAIMKRDVAIPVNQFKETNGKLVLPGATKETLRDMPPLEYAPTSEGRAPRN